MNYKYNKLSDHNLHVLLERYQSLRYEAQLELLKELKSRGSKHVGIDELKEALERKQSVLDSLGFIDQMGYTATTQGNSTIITRRFWPQFMEMVSLFLGVVFVFLGMYGIVSLYILFTGEESVGLQQLLVHVFFTYLGYQGFKMLGGLPRFINNLGMKFSFSEKQVELVKRIEFSKETITGTAADMSIEESEDTLVLKFKEESVLVGNPKSFTQKATLQSLLENIHNGRVPAQLKETSYVSE